MDIRKVMSAISDLVRNHVSLGAEAPRFGLYPIGTNIFVVPKDEGDADALEKIFEPLHGKLGHITVLAKFDQGMDEVEDEFTLNVMHEALNNIHGLECLESSSVAPGLGLVIQVERRPTTKELGYLRQNLNMYGADGGYHRLVILEGEDQTIFSIIETGLTEDSIEKNKEGKPEEVDLVPTPEVYPDRETIISKDEIINLKIGLETNMDVLDFLKALEG